MIHCDGFRMFARSDLAPPTRMALRLSRLVTADATLTSPAMAEICRARKDEFLLMRYCRIAPPCGGNGSPKNLGSDVYDEDWASARCPANLSKGLLHAQLCAQIGHRLLRPRLPNS